MENLQTLKEKISDISSSLARYVPGLKKDLHAKLFESAGILPYPEKKTGGEVGVFVYTVYGMLVFAAIANAMTSGVYGCTIVIILFLSIVVVVLFALYYKKAINTSLYNRKRRREFGRRIDEVMNGIFPSISKMCSEADDYSNEVLAFSQALPSIKRHSPSVFVKTMEEDLLKRGDKILQELRKAKEKTDELGWLVEDMKALSSLSKIKGNGVFENSLSLAEDISRYLAKEIVEVAVTRGVEGQFVEHGFPISLLPKGE